jgi:hypothetical protein
MKYQYTMIILNWKRPNNVINIITALHDYPYVTSIIVSNGHPNNQLFFKDFKKVVCFNDSKLNLVYGLDLRFIRGLSAQTDKLIIIDDDIVVDHNNLTKLLNNYEKNPNRIVGYEGRNMESDTHYYKSPPKSQYCDIVLTRLLVCDKMLCNLFFKCKPIIEHIYREGKPYGNGEDILLSFIGKIYYNVNKHYLVSNIVVTELPNQYSINGHNNHIPYRKNLCSFLKLYIDLFKEIICIKNDTTIQQNNFTVIDNNYRKLYDKNVKFGLNYTK